MQIKTILNRIQKHPGFVYGTVQLEEQIGGVALTVDIAPHRRNRPRCASYGQAGAVLGPAGAAPVRIRADVGAARLLPLRDAARRLPALWRHRRAGALGRGQAPAHHHLHVVPRALELPEPEATHRFC